MLCCLEKLLPLPGLPFSSPPLTPAHLASPSSPHSAPWAAHRQLPGGSSASPKPPTPPAHLQPLSNMLSDEKGKRHDLNLTSHPKLCL